MTTPTSFPSSSPVQPVERVLTLGPLGSSVYTASNFLDWKKNQDLAYVQREQSKVAMPVFAHDNGAYLKNGIEQKGSKKYAAHSWATMLHKIRSAPATLRTYYELVYYDTAKNEGTPVNLFADADLDYSDVVGKLPDDIMEIVRVEFFACIELVIAQLVAEGERGWTTAWTQRDFEVHELCADIPGVKGSRHYIMHLPGHAMFRDVVHLKYFMARVMATHHARFNMDKEASPFYYFSKRYQAWVNIIDLGVLSRNRAFRMIGCVKARTDAKKRAYPLAPPCDHGDVSCADANCFYRHQFKVRERDFLASLITFITPGPDGLPVAVPLLDVSEVVIPWHKAHDHTIQGPRPVPTSGRARAVATTGRPRLFSMFSGNSSSPVTVTHGLGHHRRSWREIFGIPAEIEPEPGPASKRVRLGDGAGDGSVDVASQDRGSSSGPPSLRSIMDAIVAALASHTGNQCFVDSVNDEGSALVRVNSKACPYKGSDHTNNHIAYMIRLSLPVPIVYLHCYSQICKDKIKDGEAKKVFIQLDPDKLDDVCHAIRRYFLAQKISGRMLCLGE